MPTVLLGTMARMVASPHMAVGAAVATGARTPGEALWRGAVTHLLLDMVPHYDYPLAALKRTAPGLDLAVGALLANTGSHPYRFAGAFGAILPDLVKVAELKLGLDVTTTPHNFLHNRSRPGRVWGTATQLAVIAGAVLYMRNRNNDQGLDAHDEEGA